MLPWEWIFRYLKCSYGPDKLAPFRYRLEVSKNVLHWPNLVLAPIGVQFLDFQLRSFVDPKPVELAGLGSTNDLN